MTKLVISGFEGSNMLITVTYRWAQAWLVSMTILAFTRINVDLVQVLKHEWPARWPRFIPDLVAAAKSSETLCENCMVILKVGLRLLLIPFLVVLL